MDDESFYHRMPSAESRRNGSGWVIWVYDGAFWCVLVRAIKRREHIHDIGLAPWMIFLLLFLHDPSVGLVDDGSIECG